ncbi:MAG: GNAT family protein [Planctomycetota bacterium]
MSIVWGNKLPTLAAERLDLRWLSFADCPDLFAVFGNPEVMKYWSSSAWSQPSQAADYVASIQRNFAAKSILQWGICLRETNTIIGTCSLVRVDLSQKRSEIGIIMGEVSWGQGLASEALETVIQFAFHKLELLRLEADVDPNNLRSLALFEKQGFQREGLLRERWRVHGEVQDSVFLGLLQREWKGRR